MSVGCYFCLVACILTHDILFFEGAPLGMLVTPFYIIFGGRLRSVEGYHAFRLFYDWKVILLPDFSMSWLELDK